MRRKGFRPDRYCAMLERTSDVFSWHGPYTLVTNLRLSAIFKRKNMGLISLAASCNPWSWFPTCGGERGRGMRWSHVILWSDLRGDCSGDGSSSVEYEILARDVGGGWAGVIEDGRFEKVGLMWSVVKGVVLGDVRREFAIKDLGDLSYFLGLEVSYTNDGLFLSTYGYSIFLGGNLVSWSAKKQPTVSRSSCESEYRAMANTAAEIIWITHLLRELHALPPDRPTLLCDNKSALFMSQNPVSHKRAKHIDLDYHFVRELVASGKLYTKFIPTKLQVADIFTKSLPRPQFEYFRSLLRLGPPPIRLRGDIR
ncbi:uncharacterized mitochondrial protein-like protein [Tanacetum coccineum]